MKKILFVTDESVLAGKVNCGIAEVVDSLATSLTDLYEVSVYCPRGTELFIKLMAATPVEIIPRVEMIKMFNVTYYMDKDFPSNGSQILRLVQPDILHCFAVPSIINSNTKPVKTVYTIENLESIEGEIENVEKFDTLLSVSKAQAEKVRPALHREVTGLINGILKAGYNPEKGTMLAASYSPNNQAGKAICKTRLCRTYGISENKIIYLLMGRLIPEKGIDKVIEAIPTIKANNGILLVVGRGNSEYEEKLQSFSRQDGVVWTSRWANPVQGLTYLSGADYLVHPSASESCGLTAMKAAIFGTVPITTLVDGLGENMKEDFAIIIKDGNLIEAIEESARLYEDKDQLAAKRANGMIQDFFWDTRRQGYINVYESN